VEASLLVSQSIAGDEQHDLFKVIATIAFERTTIEAIFVELDTSQHQPGLAFRTRLSL
jgi:hypothetical protein